MAVELLDRRFKLKESETNVRTEVLAGITTFLTMSYIIFVNPIILGISGMDKGAVMVATCVCAAVCSILIGLLANYPIAGAPGMGHNAFFAFVVCGVMGYRWQEALAAVFLSGVLFILLSVVKFRESLVDAVPASLKHGIAVGIGLLIALIGMEWGGVVKGHPATFVTIGNLNSMAVLISGVGFAVMVILNVLRVRGAILLGLMASLAVGLATGVAKFEGIVSAPPPPAPTLLKFDFAGLFKHGIESFLPVIFVFFLTDVFDTVGTLIGVSSQAGLLKNGKLPRAERALLGDAIATTLGGVLGTSTITAYIESATGVAAGGRTGLTAIVTGLLMLVGLFFFPIVKMMSAAIQVTKEFAQYPIIAPALILVGSFMLNGVRHINWDDFTEALPAFLTITIMAYTVSITDGIAFGFASYCLLKLLSGRGREVHWLIYLFAALLLLRFPFLKPGG